MCGYQSIYCSIRQFWGVRGGEEDVQREFVTIYISSYPQDIGDKLSFTYI